MGNPTKLSRMSFDVAECPSMFEATHTLRQLQHNNEMLERRVAEHNAARDDDEEGLDSLRLRGGRAYERGDSSDSSMDLVSAGEEAPAALVR